MIAVVPGANGTVSEAQALAAIGTMQAGDILMLQLEIPATAVEAALRAARAKGIVSMLNTAPLTPDAGRLAALADIVVANETEFELLARTSKLDAAAREAELGRIHAATGQTYVVTLGAEGVIAARGGEIIRTTGLKNEPVDTVGAGDTFCGYLAAGLDRGLALPPTLRVARSEAR